MSSEVLPPSLDGSQGLNRSLEKPQITANTDFAAINCWLAEYKKSAATYRNYKKDAERLLLWSINEKQKPLSSLTSDDLLAYSQFLENPPANWCGPKLARKGKRWSSNWKPFVGALKPKAKETTFANLRSLFNFLIEVQYLKYNPLIPVRRRVRHEISFVERRLELNERIIQNDEWLAIESTLQELPEKTHEEKWEKIRAIFLFSLYFHTAIRVSELVSHSMRDFKKIYDHVNEKERWWLYVTGKGNKLRSVPIPDSFLSTLIAYRRFLGLPDFPQPNEEEPLIRALSQSRPITDRRVNQIIKEITEKAANYFDEKQQPEKATRLRRFSSHWMRHLSLNMQDKAQVNRKHMQDGAGHANGQTTELYLHSLDNERHEDMQKLSCGLKIIEKGSNHDMENRSL